MKTTIAAAIGAESSQGQSQPSSVALDQDSIRLDTQLMTRRAIESALPSYCRHASQISYDLDLPGLRCSMQVGPYSGHSKVDLINFALTYDPKTYKGPTLLKIGFGNQPISLGMDSVDYAMDSSYSGAEGKMLEVYLKSSPGQNCRHALIMINRDTGLFAISPQRGFLASNEALAALTLEMHLRKDSYAHQHGRWWVPVDAGELTLPPVKG